MPEDVQSRVDALRQGLVQGKKSADTAFDDLRNQKAASSPREALRNFNKLLADIKLDLNASFNGSPQSDLPNMGKNPAITVA